MPVFIAPSQLLVMVIPSVVSVLPWESFIPVMAAPVVGLAFMLFHGAPAGPLELKFTNTVVWFLPDTVILKVSLVVPPKLSVALMTAPL